jgi:F-type H+-transporting ATPase subunit delta
VNPSLLGYEAAVLAAIGAEERRLVADELGELELATAQPALRSALTDTSIGASSRRRFVADLLEGKVSGPTARIAAFAASSSAAQDVPQSITEAAQRARLMADGDALDEPALSVISSRKRVGGYAAAIFEDQHTEALEGVEDELFAWAQAVQENSSLRGVLTNRDLPATERASIVSDLLAGRVSSITTQLATYAIVGGRARDLVGTLQWLVDQVAAERGWRVARVRTAQRIDDASRVALTDSLRALVGRPVELEVAEQPNLLCGVIIEVGDLRVDATARGRLDTLREHLTTDLRHEWRGAASSTQGAT